MNAEVPTRTIGRYALFEPIAQGGMASVHFGRLRGAAGFTKTVAIKRVRTELGTDPSYATMLTDEARLSSRIRHPNVVETLDVLTDGDELFLVLEYVHGESLARLARAANDRKRGIGLRIAVAIIADVLRGLHAAHEARGADGEPLELVHRDVSPQNVIVDDNGVSRVLDFGVAKARQRDQYTDSGQIKGKVRYMAPEQIHGEVSRRSDLFAAGVIAWELVTGEDLFRGPTEAATIAKVLGERIPRPRERNQDIPEALDAVIMRALDRRSEARFATAEEMLAALTAAAPAATTEEVARWVRELAGPALANRERRRLELERAQDTPSPISTTAVTQAAEASSRSPPRRMLALVAALSILAAIALFWMAFSRGTPDSSAASPAPAPTPSPTVSASMANGAPSAALAAEPSATVAPASAATTIVRKRPATKTIPVPDARCNPPYEFKNGVKTYKRECFPAGR